MVWGDGTLGVDVQQNLEERGWDREGVSHVV